MPGATPISHWIGFHLFVLVLLGLELVYARRQGPAKTHSTAVAATILWIAAALAFALFVFLILFRVFNIGPSQQPKVLFWGVAGAILMRGAFIAAGLGLLDRFEWI